MTQDTAKMHSVYECRKEFENTCVSEGSRFSQEKNNGEHFCDFLFKISIRTTHF